MMNWARIEGDYVVEITGIDPQGRFHPDFIWIPCGEEVRQGWLYRAGEFFAPEVNFPEPAAPQCVTRAQGKAALILAGLWESVITYVQNLTNPTEKLMAEIALNDTAHWQRTSPFLNAVANALDISSDQLDDLFQQAEALEL